MLQLIVLMCRDIVKVWSCCFCCYALYSCPYEPAAHCPCSQVVLVCVHDGPSGDNPVQQHCNLAAAQTQNRAQEHPRGCLQTYRKRLLYPTAPPCSIPHTAHGRVLARTASAMHENQRQMCAMTVMLGSGSLTHSRMGLSPLRFSFSKEIIGASRISPAYR
jgi:hypothetical protein